MAGSACISHCVCLRGGMAEPKGGRQRLPIEQQRHLTVSNRLSDAIAEAEPLAVVPGTTVSARAIVDSIRATLN